MPILVACPQCDVKLKVPEIAAGKSVKCPKCAATIDVPAAPSPPQGVSPQGVAPVAAVQAEAPALVSAAPSRPRADDRPSRRPRRDRDDDDYDSPRRWRRRDIESSDGASNSSNGLCMGLGIGAICLGIIAGIFAFIPCCGAFVAWPAGGIGLLLGLIGLGVALVAKQKSAG